MHVIFRESRGLEETEVATDLGQSPAPLIVLSFSDSDLGAFAAGWHRGRDDLPELRLANLAALKHPSRSIPMSNAPCRAHAASLSG
jgi:cobaltochelatase CobN